MSAEGNMKRKQNTETVSFLGSYSRIWQTVPQAMTVVMLVLLLRTFEQQSDLIDKRLLFISALVMSVTALVHGQINRRSPAGLFAFPFLFVFNLLFMAFPATFSAPGPSAPDATSWSPAQGVLFSVALMSGALAAGFIYRPSLLRIHFLARHHTRKEVRNRVGKLVRLSVSHSMSDTKANLATSEHRRSPLVFSFLLRDVSESGMGLTGFADDVAQLAALLAPGTDPVSVSVRLGGQRFSFSARLHWIVNHGANSSCGLSLTRAEAKGANEGLNSLVEALASAAPSNTRVRGQRFLFEDDLTIFKLLLWAFSSITLVFLTL